MNKLLPTFEDIKTKDEKLHTPIFVCLGGSHAYGTNVETSDVDIRGIAMNSPEEILTGRDFEQVVYNEEDTTIYSFNKAIKLFAACNPNIVELLGVDEDQMIVNNLGRMLLNNKHIFLSKQCMYSFGGYANAQLRRLQNKTLDKIEWADREKHICNSIKHAKETFNSQFNVNPEDIEIYVSESSKENYDTELFIDWNIEHLPLRDFRDTINGLTTIIGSYDKVGKRNENAISHDKLGKHMMHLVRLHLMCIDILEKQEIITHRVKEHDMLMSIRNGEYLENDVPTDKFYKLVDKLEEDMNRAYANSKLPDRVNMDEVRKLQAGINKRFLSEYSN